MIESSRRKKPRFPINIDGYYLQDKIWEECKIYDLNLEGAGLNLKKKSNLNEIIKIKFKKSGDYVFEAKVINLKTKGIGIKFINLYDDDIEYLTKIINSHSNRYKIN